MGWKSTKTITRDKIIKEIEKELINIEKLSDETLCDILETISDDANSEVYSGYNYMIDDENE